MVQFYYRLPFKVLLIQYFSVRYSKINEDFVDNVGEIFNGGSRINEQWNSRLYRTASQWDR